MQMKLHWQDVAQFLEQRLQPVIMIERPLIGNRVGANPNNGGVFSAAQIARVGEFWVPTSPLVRDDVAWSLTSKDQFVRVPMHAYDTPEPAKSVILAVGIEIGMRAMMSFAAKATRRPEEVTLVLGTQVDRSPDGGHRCYVGMAIQI